jgi:hypothetical protein
MHSGDQPKDDHDGEGIPSPGDGGSPGSEAEEKPTESTLQLLKKYSPAVLRAEYKKQEDIAPKTLLQALAALEDMDIATKDRIRPIIEDYAPRLALRNVVYLVLVIGPSDYLKIAVRLAFFVFAAILLLLTWVRAEGWWIAALAAVVGLPLLAFQVVLSIRFMRLFRSFRWPTDPRVPGYLMMMLFWIILAQQNCTTALAPKAPPNHGRKLRGPSF